MVASYSYDAFGAPLSASESFANSWSNPYRYAGSTQRLYDPETGLYLDGGSAYNPALGRELSNASVGAGMGMAMGAGGYVADGNNPLTTTGGGQTQAAIGGLPATSAGGDSCSPFGIRPMDCGGGGGGTGGGGGHGGGGGGGRAIRLNGRPWHENEALQPTVRGRLQFAQDFGRQYSRNGDDWNRAEEGFMRFLLQNRANRMAKSPYWGGVDKILTDAMFDAAWRFQNGKGFSPFRADAWWMIYIMCPGNFWFWLAHNDSINEGTFDKWSSGLSWYHHEPWMERVFINDALWALYLTGFVEIGASIAAAVPFTPHVLKRVLGWFIAHFGSASGLVEFLSSRYYPKRYAVEWTWFFTPLGAVMTTAACIKPVFSGRCGL